MSARMLLLRRGLAALLLLAWIGPTEAHRLALVIGNDTYQHAEPLHNARADGNEGDAARLQGTGGGGR
jgi:hypothetical protein